MLSLAARSALSGIAAPGHYGRPGATGVLIEEVTDLKERVSNLETEVRHLQAVPLSHAVSTAPAAPGVRLSRAFRALWTS